MRFTRQLLARALSHSLSLSLSPTQQPPLPVTPCSPHVCMACSSVCASADQQILVLTVISLIVLISPTVGIQMARKAISDIKDEDDDRFSGNSDPTWNSGADQNQSRKRSDPRASNAQRTTVTSLHCVIV